MNDTVRVRRGRGFNAQEVANLRSWGYEPRPDEIERPEDYQVTGQMVTRNLEILGIPELAILRHSTAAERYAEILRRIGGLG